MKWTNDKLPAEIVFPLGPIDIVGGVATWDKRFGNEPNDIEQFIKESFYNVA